MNTPRAEFATLYFKGAIYVLGGEGLAEGEENKTQQIRTLNSVEVYSIENDTWSTFPSFTKARQNFSVCSFNDKFLFLFGGKFLKAGQAYASGPKPYEYVQAVEVLEISTKTWKTINYIGENQRL